MPTSFRPYQPKQKLWLPPDLRDWLPKGHLAYQVSDLVDGLDLTAFYAPSEGDGRRNAPYEPRMLVKLLIYGYATGVFSARKIAKKLEEDVVFRMLAAGNFPKHRTICEFRRRHLEDFRKLFLEGIGLAREMGLAKLGKLSIDGTKVRANASQRKAMTYRRMKREERRLEKEIGAWLRRADEIDGEEDARYGPDRRGTSCRKSCGVERIDWQRFRRPRRGWRRRNERRTKPGDGNRDRIGIRREDGDTSAPTENRVRRPRATSRIRRAGS